MKNINKILTLLLFIGFSACDSTDDLFKEIDSLSGNSNLVENIVLPDYTLTEDDYNSIDQSFGNFSAEADAKSKIPTVLSSLYSQFGKGSSVLVTYDFFNGSSPDLRGTQFVNTVSAAEYTELGFGFGNFSNLGVDIPKYASFKEPGAGDGDYMDITHEYFNSGSTTTVTNRAVYTVAYGWKYAWVLPDATYGDFFNESGIDFSNSGEGLEKLPVYLNEFNVNFVAEGTILVAQYNHDNDNEGPTPAVGLYIFSGTEWLLYNDHYQVTQKSLKFGHDGSVWVPDNTVQLTLGSDDYAAIAAATATSNDAGSSSLGNFGNYDLSLWSSEQIFSSITDRLIEKFPTVEGQKYIVNYATWEPGAGSGSIFVIYEGGAYVVFTP